MVPAARYVTRERVEAMLDYEFLQCNLTLRTQRGDKTAFFAFADTLTTKVWLSSSHRWLEGLKYFPPCLARRSPAFAQSSESSPLRVQSSCWYSLL